MSHLKPIILCADDFGLNPGISQGILNLVQQKRLSAVSCMTNSTDFAAQAASLLQYKDQVQIGLHFNLTEGTLFSGEQGTPLKKLLWQSYTRRLNPAKITKELHDQLDHFVETFGVLPDFIDGHHHIHQLPMVGPQLLQVYEQKLRANGTYIRATYPAFSLSSHRFKTKVLATLGGKRFQQQLAKKRIAHNPFFSGLYHFNGDTNYRSYFRQWLTMAKPHTLIMCHPGLTNESQDSNSASRLIEFDYFASDDFLQDCADLHIQLSPLIIKA
ncbi:MAG: ChbG/HpnK family deacetylase [Legionella sp.]|nr:MAG: ChbG/HpnK family deacetylase [Legionella sp.]